MNDSEQPGVTQPFRRLTLRSAVALAIGAALAAACYAWIDRPVAFYVHDHQFNQYRVFKWLTYPPPWVQTFSPLLLAVLIASRAWRPWPRCQLALFVACLSLIVADEFRTSLGDLMGRYWPETWHDNNPSLIGNGTYGFHFLASGDDVGSFPSGHAARILGFVSVWWIAVPRTRVFCVAASAPMLVSLVAMNYHFVGDVVAGSFLGGIVGAIAARLGGFSDNT